MNNIILMQGTTYLRNDWKEYVKAVEAPSNYKDPAKIEEYIKNKTADLEKEVQTTCHSLIEIDDVEMWISEEITGHTKASSIDDLARMIYSNKDSLFIGDKSILYAVFSHPMNDEKYASMVRLLLFTGELKVKTIEEFRFPCAERKMIITEKLLPKRNNGESDIDYYKRLFSFWNFVPEDGWTEL